MRASRRHISAAYSGIALLSLLSRAVRSRAVEPDERKLSSNDGANARSQVATKGSSVFSVGHLEASIGILAIPQEAAARMLPAHLKLASQDIVAPGLHPIILLYGHQSDVRPVFFPFPGMNYLEFVLGLPFVRHKDDGAEKLLSYMPRLFLNDWLATVAGIWIYGMEKRQARMRATADGYWIRALDSDAPLIAGEFTSEGQVGHAGDFPNFAQTRQLFELPLVMRDRLGTWRCADYDFRLGTALIEPLTINANIQNAFVPALPVGNFSIESILASAVGAFRVKTDWTMSPPLASRACLRNHT